MSITRSPRTVAIATIAAAALVGVSAPAHAATHPAAAAIAAGIGAQIETYAHTAHVPAAALTAIHHGLDASGDDALARAMTVTGIVDANGDGLDDDAALTITAYGQSVVLHLGADTAQVVPVPAAPRPAHPHAPAITSAAAAARLFDADLRAAARARHTDTWDMHLIAQTRAGMPSAVRVISDYDANRDGLDDDGRLSVLVAGSAVTLTLGNTPAQAGTVTAGPTWSHRVAPRHHHRTR